MINARNIGFGELRTEKLEYLSEDTIKRLSSHLLHTGDLVFGRKGTVERHVLIRPEYDRWFQGTDCLRIRFKSKSINPRFISYTFLTDYHKQWMINQSSHGATMTSLNQGIISRIPLNLPDIHTQNKIAFLLSAYDDLIQNNTRRIGILEEMAQTLYQEWFVNFRFPGHEGVRMVESELGPVPEGWDCVRLNTIAEINANSIKRGQEPDKIGYIDISSVTTGAINQIEMMNFSDSPGRARRIVHHGDIIWSMVRPNRKSYCLIFDPEPNTIVSTGFAVIRGKNIPFTYLYHHLTTDDFVSYLTNNATGAAYPAVKTNDFENAKIIRPEDAVLKKFHDIVEPIYEMKFSLAQKNTNLRHTRDLLLPKLISGELDVSELDIRIPEAEA